MARDGESPCGLPGLLWCSLGGPWTLGVEAPGRILGSRCWDMCCSGGHAEAPWDRPGFSAHALLIGSRCIISRGTGVGLKADFYQGIRLVGWRPRMYGRCICGGRLKLLAARGPSDATSAGGAMIAGTERRRTVRCDQARLSYR